MPPVAYLTVFIVPLVTLLGFYLGGAWTYATPIIAYVIIPVLEGTFKGNGRNLEAREEERARGDWLYDFILYAAVPTQFAVIYLMLHVVSLGNWTPVELGGIIFSTGICCVALGINIAHELGHRTKTHEKLMARGLLLTSLYMHWVIEHVRGHHSRVATPEDAASARYGENVYAFIARSVYQTFISSWKLESRRLQNRGKSTFSIYNEIIWFYLIEAACVGLIYLVYGLTPTLAFVAAAVIGFVLLEVVNYIEHYGLSRRFTGERYEKVLPVHSWNADYPLGRVFLFNLTRHSDHHANAARKYQVLRHFDESPQMPAGYPTMIMLSLIPPLWFRVMHKQIAAYQRSAARPDSAAPTTFQAA